MEDYKVETETRLIKRVKDHSGKELESHLFKHLVKTDHKMVTLDDFKIIRKGYKRPNLDANKLIWRSSLQTEKVSVPLKLIN